MKKRLLLTYPNQRWEKQDITTTWNLSPNVLCLLAKMVEDDVDVKIVDCQFYDLSIDQFKAEIAAFRPDYVGISVLTSEYARTLDVAADAVKAAKSDTIVIAGGVYPTVEYERVLRNPNVDFAVRGEGEYVLPELLAYIDGRADDLPHEGIVSRKADGTLDVRPRSLVADLTRLPWPDYSLVNLDDYLNTGARHGPMRAPAYPAYRCIVTRGCPVGCSFCQVEYISGKNVRTRDPEDIVNELAHLRDRHGIKSVIFEDDNMSLPKKFFLRLMEIMIERELNLKWIISSFAIFTIDKRMLELMQKSGCVGVNVAIESGTPRVMREIVGKPLLLDKVPGKIQELKDHGMFVLANFIVGFPGETWDEIRETIRFAELSGADYVKIFVAVPLKGTQMWDKAVELGVLDRPHDQVEVDWRYGQISSDEWTSKDISILRAYEWDRINFSTAERRKRVAEIWGMSEDEMAAIRQRTRDALSFDANLVSNTTTGRLLTERRSTAA